MTKEKQQTTHDEHPWIHHARMTKMKNNEALRSVPPDRWIQSDRHQPAAPWIPYVLVGTLLIFSAVAFVLAWKSRSTPAQQAEQSFTIWHWADEGDMHELRSLTSQLTDESVLPIIMTTPYVHADMLPFVLLQDDGPDVLLVEQAMAQRLAEDNLLLTLRALSPLYRIPAEHEYFYPLRPHDTGTASVGFVIPRTTKQPHLARQFIAALQREHF